MNKYRSVTVVFLTFAASVVLLSGCRQPLDLQRILDGATGEPLSVTPNEVTLSFGQTVQLESSGGTPPYAYSVDGAAAEVGRVDSGGLYTAPSNSGSVIITVSDEDGNSVHASVTIAPPNVDYSVAAVGNVGETGVGGGVFSGTFAIANSGSDDGTEPVLWTAYVSIDGVLGGGGESIVASGATTPVSAESRSTTIGFDGLWPRVAGVYTLIVSVAAADDRNAANNWLATSEPTAVSGIASPIDYGNITVTHGSSGTGGGPISGSFTFENRGGTDGVSQVTYRAYVSIDDALGGGDTEVAGGTTTGLAAGASSGSIDLSGTWPAVDGTYYLIVSVSSTDDLDNTDNIGVSSPVIVSGSPPLDVNYLPQQVAAMGGNPKSGSAFSESFTVTQNGADDGTAAVQWTAVLSAGDQGIGLGDQFLDNGTIAPLPAGATSPAITLSGTWPEDTTTDYYLVVRVTAADDVDETDDVRASGAFTLTPPVVDYEIASLTEPDANATGGGTINGAFVIRNTGADGGAKPIQWTAYVSSDGVLGGGGESMIDFGSVSPLAAGAESASVPFSGTWPTSPNSYQLIVAVQAEDDVVPLNDSAVSTGSATVAGVASNVDYDSVDVTHGSGTTGGQSVEGSLTFRNDGSTDGVSDVTWKVYASTDEVIGGGDELLDSGTVAPPAAGTTTAAIPFSGVWPAQDGTYYLIVSIGSSEDGDVTDNTGRTAAIPVTGSPLPNIDYTVRFAATAPSSPTAGSSFSEQFFIENAGDADGTAQVYWNAYLSTDTVLDATDDVFASGNRGALSGLASSSPIALSGTWRRSPVEDQYLIVSVSAVDDVNVGNDTVASPAFQLVAPNVDYVVSSLAEQPATATGGGALTGTFAIENGGSDDGYELVTWTVYASTDGVLDGTGEIIIDAGTESALDSGATPVSITYSGAWPAAADEYSIIVALSAADDLVDGGDVRATTGVTTVAGVASNVDYGTVSVTHDSGDTGGGAVSGSFTFRNNGSTAGVSNVTWKVYASTDGILGGGDVQLDTGTTAALGAASDSSSIGFTGTWPAEDGTYYLIVSLASPDDGNAGDNTNSTGPITVTGSPVPDVDYDVISLPASVTTPNAGSSFSERFGITNVGTDAGSSTIYWTAYVSEGDATLDGSDDVLATGQVTPLSPGESATDIPLSGMWPRRANTNQYLIVDLSASDDTNTTNDVGASAAFELQAPAVDYDVYPLTDPPANVIAGGAISGSFIVTNAGADDGYETIVWTAYVSSDDTFDGSGESVIDSGTVSPVPAGTDSAPINFGGFWPATLGDYRLFISVSADDDIASANNVEGTNSTTVNDPAAPVDYTNVTVTHDSGAIGGQVFSASFTFDNTETADGADAVSWSAYVSTDAVSGFGDTLVDSGTTSSLSAESQSASIPFTGTWPAVDGTYYLIVTISAGDDVVFTNNEGVSAGVPVSGSPPPDVDYAVSSFSAVGTPTVSAGSISETLVIGNVGADDGSQAVLWTVYASKGDTNLDGFDTLIDAGQIAALPSGTNSAAISVDGEWPDVPASDYYLVVELLSSDDVDVANDTGSAGPFDVRMPDVDYTVSSVSSPGSSVAPGQAVSQSFTLANLGADFGSATVFWYAYASPTPSFDSATAIFVDSGSTSAIGAFPASTSVPIGGTWPANAGAYYLVVRISAQDDLQSGNNIGSSAPFAVSSPTSIDYVVTSVSSSYQIRTTGSSVSERFTVYNIGDVDGVEDLRWDAYASTDSTLDGTDVWMSGGTLPALLSETSHSNVFIGGTWPVVPGQYYLFVTVSAADETEPGNNTRAAVGQFTVYDPPDYAIGSVTASGQYVWDHGGEVASQLSVATPAASNYRFTIDEPTGNPGNHSVEWQVMFSRDTTPDGTDPLVATGTMAPFSGATRTVEFDGPLPATPGEYHMIVVVTSGDDAALGNNIWASSAATRVYSPLAEDNVDLETTNESLGDMISVARDFHVQLDAGDTAAITGSFDEILHGGGGPNDYFGGSSFYVIYLNSNVYSVSIYATWTDPLDDALDLYFHDDVSPFSQLGSSIEEGVDREPAVDPDVLTYVLGGKSRVYIDAYSFPYVMAERPGGEPFTLFIQANPF